MSTKSSIWRHATSAGLALFSMFFGAGNIIFPLNLGQLSGDQTHFAVSGLLISAVVMPFMGVIAMLLFEGDTKAFFGRLGKVPGFLMALLILSLLGPLGSTPRCVALSYATVHQTFLPNCPPILFSAVACALIYCAACRKHRIMTLLGWILTPALLLSIAAIIGKGLITAPDAQPFEGSSGGIFLTGLKEGYYTMDLLAAFFFSASILSSLRKKCGEAGTTSLKLALRGSLIGAGLLALIYIGFCYVASYHGSSLGALRGEEFLTVLMLKVAGPYGGLIVACLIALACLTTAIALSSVFAEFFQKEVLRNSISYEMSLAGTLIVTFFVSIFELGGIAAFLSPVLEVCYPALIVLTMANLAHRLFGFRPVVVPVALTFAATILFQVFG